MKRRSHAGHAIKHKTWNHTLVECLTMPRNRAGVTFKLYVPGSRCTWMNEQQSKYQNIFIIIIVMQLEYDHCRIAITMHACMHREHFVLLIADRQYIIVFFLYYFVLNIYHAFINNKKQLECNRTIIRWSVINTKEQACCIFYRWYKNNHLSCFII